MHDLISVYLSLRVHHLSAVIKTKLVEILLTALYREFTVTHVKVEENIGS